MVGDTIKQYFGKTVKIETDYKRGISSFLCGVVSDYDKDYITLNPWVTAPRVDIDELAKYVKFQLSITGAKAFLTDKKNDGPLNINKNVIDIIRILYED